ncbi:MAG: ABC transporter permease [Chloroflexi bacterium]|nr:ABC transporter permease [Chloroflexota bacterium]
MSDVALRRRTPVALGPLLGGLARQRELSLVIVMLVLGAFVYWRAPQFLSPSNLSQVLIEASIIGIAATGQAVVVITRNVDLSVDAMIGVVAFSVADILRVHALPLPLAMAYGVGLGLVLGVGNGVLVSWFRVPAIVATLGTMSVYRGVAFLLAGGRQVSLSDLPPQYIALARASLFGTPLYALVAVVVVVIVGFALQQLRFGREIYAVGSNPEAAAILGIRSRLVVFVAFSLCGLLAGVAGVLWGARFGTINATAANGVVLQVVAAVVVGGVNIFGGSGTVYGAALGALFLSLIANALTLLHLSQFWLQAIYGAVILAAVAADSALVRRFQRATGARGRRLS